MAVDLGVIYTGDSPVDWSGFYDSVLGTYRTNRATTDNAVGKNGIGKAPSFADLKDFILTGSGQGVAATKEEIASGAGAGVPISGGGGLGGFDIGPLIARAAVIIAGFIFVAAGLAMFKPGVTVMQSAKGVVNGVARGVPV